MLPLQPLFRGLTQGSMETDVEKHYIIDFDGTFTKVEALEILAEISLAAHPDRDQLLKVVKNLTRRGMEGEMDLDFSSSRARLLATFASCCSFAPSGALTSGMSSGRRR